MSSETIYSILSSKSDKLHYISKYCTFIENCKIENIKNTPIVKIKHHICPKAIFKEYINLKQYKWNCAVLSKRQHLVAHKMLSKIFGRSQKFALISMAGTSDYKKLTSREYEKLTQECSGENHPLYGKSYIERYGEERAAEILIKISGDNAVSKTPHNRKANSDSKQNRVWVTDGINDRFIDKSDIPEDYVTGRSIRNSTIVPEMIQRSLKHFGIESEDALLEILTKEVLVDGLLLTQFNKKYSKDGSCDRRDPSIRYFLKKFGLFEKIQPRTIYKGLPKGTKHFSEKQLNKALLYFGFEDIEHCKEVLSEEVKIFRMQELKRKYRKENPSSREPGIEYFLKLFKLTPTKTSEISYNTKKFSAINTWYVTPLGAFLTTSQIPEIITGSILKNICRNCDREIIYKSYYLNPYLKENFTFEELKGKTFRDIGFYTITI